VTWSRVVTTAEEAAGDALDLRAADLLSERWRAAGFTELVPGELVRPVPQVLRGVEQTRALGARLAGSLRPGDLVVLSGPLGAGKTALAQGIGAGLAVEGRVTSPTFVLARVHRGPLPLVHVDAYRLRDTGAPGLELDDLDLDADLPSSVVVVEWGEGLVEGLSPSRLDVALERPVLPEGAGAADQDLRIVMVRARGPRWAVLTAQEERH